MAQYPDFDCPPHFYARGNNPEFSCFVELMKYANRMCDILNGGRHKAKVAVLYDAEGDWSGEYIPMQKVCRTLMTNQIEFDIVCIDMLRKLEEYDGKVDNGKLTINGEEFDILFIPFAKHLPQSLYAFGKENSDFPIYFVGGYPTAVLMDESRETLPDAGWGEAFKNIGINEISVKVKEITQYKTLLDEELLDEEFPELSFYHYEKDKKQIIMLMNESACEDFKGSINLDFMGNAVCIDVFSKTFARLIKDNKGSAEIEISAGESLIIMEDEGDGLDIYTPISERLKSAAEVIDISKGWDVSFARAKDYPNFGKEENVEELVPLSDSKPDFSGIIRYKKCIKLDKAVQKAMIKIENIFDVLRVFVNGKEAGVKLTPPYIILFEGLL